MRKKKITLGDIYEISLPNGKNAYARLFKESTLGFYTTRSLDYSTLPINDEFEFFVSVYKDLLVDGMWKVVANRPFYNEEDSWPPPRCLVDAINHKGALYHKGHILPCSYEECKDLEIVAVWDRNHVIDRLMGNNFWQETMRKPDPSAWG